ncbi:DNA methylase [Sphingomonas suaedae]|uniref:Methyltransferase n=1 Tax=Sphingomonas suaedae TaxID=2599297 RepID=A0A518RE55_9SPHN|nr:DNA methyltransferase [Sphingomonas suaedae]QDX25728.1 DNA methylase [Sphingomonas suaedae]
MTLILPRNSILHGDCLKVMPTLPGASVDMILTDPPYVTRYRDRCGRTVLNDDNADWIEPAFAEMYRLLKPGGCAVSFYGWNSIDRFAAAWTKAGFHVLGHIVFRKRYASSRGYLARHHESAYLLAKGRPNVLPLGVIGDVIDMPYTGNRLHPTQKPVAALIPLIESFCPKGGIVLDPFCGSGSSLLAAKQQTRDWLGIELDPGHHRTASARLANEMREAA